MLFLIMFFQTELFNNHKMIAKNNKHDITKIKYYHTNYIQNVPHKISSVFIRMRIYIIKDQMILQTTQCLLVEK